MAFTYFFRDAEPLELAIEQILPAVQAVDQIEIWDAGCAHGPEPYTLGILLRERMPDSLFDKVRIHATDVDCGFAAQVGEGIFPESELRRLPAGILEKYFQPVKDTNKFEIVEEIRAKISFSHHDLLPLEPLGKNFSLIVCKNVLLHFNEQQRGDVLRMFHHALRSDGVLVLEHTQKIPASLNGIFRSLVGHAQVYGKIANSLDSISRKDLPANTRQPNLWKIALGGKTTSHRPENKADNTFSNSFNDSVRS
jgi:chemotaxis protein methyltransferase CheR